MPQNKNMHFVPQFHLRMMAKQDRHIWTYHPIKNIATTTPIKNAASISYYYREDIDNILKMLEDNVAKILHKIVERQDLSQLTQEDALRIFLFIGGQRGRTPTAEQQRVKHVDYFWDNALKDYILSKREAKEKGITKEILDTLSFKEKDPIGGTVLDSLLSAILLSDLKIALLVNKTLIPFISSDNPAVFFNTRFNKDEAYNRIGLQCPGFEVFFPITSELALYMYDPQYYDIPRLNKQGWKIKINRKGDIHKINRLQILNCQHQVYFEKEYMVEKIRKYWSEVKDRKEDSLKFFKHDVSSDQEKPNEKRIILQSSNIPPIYPLKLSFREIKTGGYPPPRIRTQELLAITKEIDRMVEEKVEKLKKSQKKESLNKT